MNHSWMYRFLYHMWLGCRQCVKTFFSYSRNWTITKKNKNHLWDWDCSRKSKCGRMENLWCQVDFSHLCGPISVWILTMRSAVLFSTRLERWWQNISDHSQNSNKISPAWWPVVNFSVPLSAKLPKMGAERNVFITIKFPASHVRHFRNFITILPYLAVLYFFSWNPTGQELDRTVWTLGL